MMSASDMRLPASLDPLEGVSPDAEVSGFPWTATLDMGAAEVFRMVSGTQRLPILVLPAGYRSSEPT